MHLRAALNVNRTRAGDIAIRVQGAAILHADAAVGRHHDITVITGRTAGAVAARCRRVFRADADGAVYVNMGAFFHGQCAERCLVFHPAVFACVLRLRGIAGKLIVKRNQKRDTGRDLIFTRRECIVLHQRDLLVTADLRGSNCRIQIRISPSVRIEYRIGLDKERLDGLIFFECNRECCLRGKEALSAAVPAEESIAFIGSGAEHKLRCTQNGFRSALRTNGLLVDSICTSVRSKEVYRISSLRRPNNIGQAQRNHCRFG